MSKHVPSAGANPRRSHETMEQYRERRRNEQYQLRQYLKGRFVWVSVGYLEGNRAVLEGTYRKAVHGTLPRD